MERAKPDNIKYTGTSMHVLHVWLTVQEIVGWRTEGLVKDVLTPHFITRRTQALLHLKVIEADVLHIIMTSGHHDVRARGIGVCAFVCGEYATSAATTLRGCQ